MNRLASVSTTGKARRVVVPAGLDGLSGTATSNIKAAYALKRLFTSYNGAIVNVRRSTDNVTQDFFGNTQGTSLTTLANGGGSTISTWLSGATAHVVTWYDQSGQGKNATQSNTTIQPILNHTSMLLDLRTNRCLDMPAATLTSGNNRFTAIVRHGGKRNASGPTFLSAGAQTGPQSMICGSTTTQYTATVWATYDILANGYADNSTAVWMYNQSNMVFFKNGSQIHSAAMVNINVQSTNTNRIGTWAGTGSNNTAYSLDGDIMSVMIFSTDLGTGDRNICEAAA